MKAIRLLILLVVLAAAGGGYYYYYGRPQPIVLSGVVTTNDVVVSPQIGGKIDRLLVTEGDTVKAGQLLAVIAPQELQAESSYAAQSAEGVSSQVQEAEAALRFQELQTSEQIRQAESMLAATEAQQAAATADLENAKLIFERTQNLAKDGVSSPQ